MSLEILPFGGPSLATRPEPASRVGSKGAGLMRMAAAGLPVPPGFVVTTEAGRRLLSDGRLPDELPELLRERIRWLEELTGRRFGSRRRPLLVSVRSGAPVSMPGMMETLLDVGLNRSSVDGLLRSTGNPRLAWDAWRRLLQSWGEVVQGCRAERFERPLSERLEASGLTSTRELDAATLRELADENLEVLRAMGEGPPPSDPHEQLLRAVEAVLRSWGSAKAVEYRGLRGIADALGTAVVVQAMVFGNAGATSGSGVGFTRNPSSGEDELYLDFLFNAQGEDVVSGRRRVDDTPRLARLLPGVQAELERVRRVLEREFGDAQDFEFTVEEGRTWLLQSRPAQRTPWAAVRIAVDLVREGLVDPATVLARLAVHDLGAIERRRLDADPAQALAEAVPAGLGVAVGAAVFDVERARARHRAGEAVVLVREDLSTEDVAGLATAEGVLTARGGRTSHAAVVARQLGKACLVGCTGLRVEPAARRCLFGDELVREGELLSLDGETGRVFRGPRKVVVERPDEALAEIARWRAARVAEA